MTEEEIEDIEFEILYDKLNEMYPKIDFIISCVKNIDDLDKSIDTENTSIYLKVVNNCYCYEKSYKMDEIKYFIVERKKNNEAITIKDCLDALVKQKLKRICNHQFLETFTKINDLTYELGFGS